MFEAYKISIKIALNNQVSSGLLAISQQMRKTGMDAEKLQLTLHRIKLLGMTGAAIGGAGFMGLGLISKMLKPAEEYAHQLNIMNMAGLKHVDMVAAIGDAWKNTGTVITTTATQNLRTILDLRNILGDMGEARMALPIVSRIQAVLASSSEGRISGNAKELAYSMAKALDLIGAAQNKESFETQAEMMSKVIIATQGRVTPEAYKSVFQYARQAKYRLNDEFKYTILSSLIQENATTGGGGGGSRGVGPMLASFYRWANQGYVNRAALPELAALGLINPNSALRTTTSGTTIGAMRNEALAASNPFLWVQEILVPAIKRRYGQNISKDTLMKHINAITRGNQLAGNLIGEFAFKPVNFYRDQAIIRGTMSTAQAYQAAISNDPNTARAALGAQWENFKTAFTMSVVPTLIPLLMDLTKGLQHLAAWMREHQGLAKKLVIGFGALAGAMAISGTLLAATAGFKAIGAVLTFAPLGGVAGLVRIAGAFTTMGSALLVMAPTLLALYAAWKGGQAIGGGIYSKIENTLFADKIGAGVAHTLAFFGNEDAQEAINLRNKSSFIATGRAPIVQVNHKSVMNGRVIAEEVSRHQSSVLFGPQRSSSTFDMTMMPPTVGMPIVGR